MSDPVYIHLCDTCKNNFVAFSVKVLNPNYEQYKCACCGKRKLCRGYKVTNKGQENKN